jgi:hypothetical protein
MTTVLILLSFLPKHHEEQFGYAYIKKPYYPPHSSASFLLDSKFLVDTSIYCLLEHTCGNIRLCVNQKLANNGYDLCPVNAILHVMISLIIFRISLVYSRSQEYLSP